MVFCNRACLEWLGLEAEAILGRTCRYHAALEGDAGEVAAAGLAPPPAAAGRTVSGVVYRHGADGAVERRRALFLSLGEGERPQGWVAVVESGEPAADAPLAAPPAAEAAHLHDLLHRLCGRLAERGGPIRLVGESQVIQRARRQIDLAAATRASVLIVGPPGSGRQRTAAAIHQAANAGIDDPGARGNLVPLACATLVAELIVSTVRALSAKYPSSRTVGPATLVFNDADQIPAEVQGELAAILAARDFPLRPIATACRGLVELAREGGYHGGLAGLLSTLVVELPPLAERRGDIPLLAQALLEECNAQGAKQLAGFTPEVLDQFHGYAWPGNVDELAGVVAEAHAKATGPLVGPGDLPARFRHALDAAARPRRPEETIDLAAFLGRVERELLERALRRAKGNKARAARLLGLSRPRLYRRMVQLGLAEEDEAAGGG